MRVNLKCFAGLSELYACDYRESTALDLPEGSGLCEVQASLGISDDEVSIVFINGKISNHDDVLRHGDNVTLVPATGGM